MSQGFLIEKNFDDGLYSTDEFYFNQTNTVFVNAEMFGFCF